MTALAHRREEIRCANPIEVFTARCQARAFLFNAGELELHEAVDVLQDAAERTGLVARLGQDAVQAMMAYAFQAIQPDNSAGPDPSNGPYHLVTRDGVASAAELQREYGRALADRFRHRLPASTVDALHYVIEQKDPRRFQQFITGRSTHERKQIRAHFP